MEYTAKITYLEKYNNPSIQKMEIKEFKLDNVLRIISAIISVGDIDIKEVHITSQEVR